MFEKLKNDWQGEIIFEYMELEISTYFNTTSV